MKQLCGCILKAVRVGGEGGEAWRLDTLEGILGDYLAPSPAATCSCDLGLLSGTLPAPWVQI